MRLLLFLFLHRHRGLSVRTQMNAKMMSVREEQRKDCERVMEDRHSPVCRVAAVVSIGLLFDGRRHNGRVRDARLVQAVRRMRHHVRREATGYQARER